MNTIRDGGRYIKEFARKRVLVVGDLMIDEYIDGSADRISPEAPIPVLLQKSVSHRLGGAGNVAANAAALASTVTLLGIVGKDARGKILTNLTREKRIRPRFLVDSTRPTTTKVRFVSGHHQLVRIDIEEVHPISRALEKQMIQMIHTLPAHHVVIVSDYGKGAITKRVLSALKEKFGAENIIADTKPAHAHFFRGLRAIAPNVKEAAEIVGIEASNDRQADKVTELLSKRLNTSVVLTRGEQGVTVREHGKKTVHFKAEVQSVRDVTGAGDTLIAVFALMLVSGGSFVEAAEMANRAAGVVVGVSGTHALTRKELEQAVSDV